MARRGSLVGDAYVRIHADSSAVDDEVRRGMQRAARPGARTFINEFQAAIQREAKSRLHAANQALVRGIVGGKAEWDRQFKASGMKSVEEFATAVRRRMQDIFDATDGRGFPKLQEALDDLNHWVSGGSLSRTERFMNLFRDGKRHVASFEFFIGKAFGKGSRNNFLNFVGSVTGGLARIIGLLTHSAFSTIGGLFRLARVGATGFLGVLKGIGTLLSGGGSGGITAALSEMGSGFLQLGKQFGASLIGALRAGLPVIAAVAAAMVALAATIPPLLAFGANLVGIFVALAGSITIGLIGGLLALGPILAATGVGIVALVVALGDLDEMTARQRKNLKPLTDAWSKIQKVLRGAVLDDLTEAFGKFGRLLDRYVLPLMKSVGTIAGEVALHLAKVLNSKEMEPFLKAWTESIPKIFESLGMAISNFTAGMIAFFTPVLQFAEELAASLEGISQQFLDWATSTEGQNAIADFMQNAWEKAKLVWDIIVLIGQAIAGLFSIGDEVAGGDFLVGIRTKLQEFVDWLNSPEGREGMETWFARAKELALTLTTSIGEISRALGAIDWESASANANTAITFISKLLAGVLVGIASINVALPGLGISWNLLGQFFVGVYNATIGVVLGQILRTIANIILSFSNFLKILSGVPGFAWVDTLTDDLDRAGAAALTLADNVDSIDTYKNIYVGLSGPGVALLHDSMARRRPDVYYASGGIINSPTRVGFNGIAGEAGREAIVPLDRPLSLIDRSVRDLAAFAQGLPVRKYAGGGVSGGGAYIAPGAIVVTAPNSDPILVAEALLDRFAGNIR